MQKAHRREDQRFEAPEGPFAQEMAYGSDAVAETLRRFDIPFVALNPGASFRGLHDSLVNYLGNEAPTMLMVLHEMHAPAIAQGYTKVTGQPMAVVLHSNVGLMNGTMGVFNAWCDRCPMLIIGATGHVDAARRRPWIEWIHTCRDQGALVRGYTKWDDQPASADAAVEAIARGLQIATTAPKGPVYINLEVDWQEPALEGPVAIPKPERHGAGPPPLADPGVVEETARRLAQAERPLLLFGRMGGTREAWDARVRLAERLNAGVLTDLKLAATFPTEHPLHGAAPGFAPGAATLAAIRAADVIVSFDWVDLGGALKSAYEGEEPEATVVSVSLDAHVHRGWSFDYHVLPPADLRAVADPDAFVRQLLDHGVTRDAAAPAAKPLPAIEADAAQRADPGGAELKLSDIAAALMTETDGVPMSLLRVPLGWPAGGCRFRDPLDYVGFDGGGGVGSGPGMAVGSALALKGSGRLPVAVMGDGDLLMGSSALWTAAKYRIPLLVVVANNRSYFNDEAHQRKVADMRGRNRGNAWVGQRLDDPAPDLAAIAKGHGIAADGPVKDAEHLSRALADAIASVRAGTPTLVDVHIAAGYESAVSTVAVAAKGR